MARSHSRFKIAAMKFEKVHTIRDLYDGVRSGTADFNGSPHYFSCPFDNAADDYADHFLLYPVSPQFMERELQYWAIYRAWEDKFHRGLLLLETHPGQGGVNADYDELSRWLNGQINSLDCATKQRAKFQAVRAQDDLPAGILRELEVNWSPMSD